MPSNSSPSARVPWHRRLAAHLGALSTGQVWTRHAGWCLGLSLSVLRWAAVLVLTLWSIVLIAWLTLHWGILPHIDEWRPQIEQRASQALGLTVRIGRIGVQSPGWIPALELADVTLADRDGRVALRLPRVSAAVSPQSAVAFRLLFSQLYIEGPELEVRRDRDGRIHVAGFDVEGSANVDDSVLLEWLFDQPELVLRHGTLRWVDQQRQAPPLELRDAEVVVRNSLSHHDLRVSATPLLGQDASAVQRFTVIGRFTQSLLARRADFSRWSGTLFADLPGADFARLRDYLSLPFDWQSGIGSARCWLDISKGQWRRATLDASLEDVELQLANSLEPLSLQKLQGRFEVERSASQLKLAAQRLAFEVDGGAVWPASSIHLVLNQRQALDRPALSDEPVTGGDFSADRLDLAMMAGIAGRLPLPANLRSAMAELAPSGLVQGMQASWSGPADEPTRYRVKGRVAGLSIAAMPAPEPDHVGRPGWRGADLEIDAGETGGEARLAVTNGAIELPGVFEDPLLPVRRFSSKLVWQITPQRVAPGSKAPANSLPPSIDLRIVDAQLANDDAHGDMQLHWHTGAGTGHGKGGRYPGVIDMTAHIEEGLADRVARYLPLGVPSSARDYVAGSVQSGTVRNARLRLRGDLQEFPFAHYGANSAEGEFHIATQVENVNFAYVPPVITGGVARWPGFTQVNGELVFDRGAMLIRNARARLWGIELKNVNGGIADLVRDQVLTMDGAGRGPLGDMLRFVSATPIDGWLSQALRETTGTGLADLALSLRIPLDDAARTTVKGSVTLPGNDVRFRGDVPMLMGAKSRIDFSQRGFSIGPGTAKALGGDVSFEGGMPPGDSVVRFNAQGTATAEGLRQATELGILPRLAGAMSGQAAYRLQLSAQRGRTELAITSPLTGMAIDLPAPLKKSPEMSWPLRIQTTALPTADGAWPRDSLRVELDGVFQAEYQRELSSESTRVLRGALAVGEAGLPVMPPTGGVAASAQVSQLNADAWLARARSWWAADARPDGRAASAEPRTEPDLSAYWPTDLSLRSNAVVLNGRRFGSLNASVQRRGSGDSELWHATAQGDALQGQIDWRPAGAGAPWGRVQARLARVSIPAAEGDGAAAAAGDNKGDVLGNGANWPALDVVVDELEWRGQKLGRLEIDGRPVDGAAPRDWRLAKLALNSSDGKLAGTGNWAAPKRRMALDLRLDVADAGNLLERFGLGKQVRGGKGHVQGLINWVGSPWAPDWSTLAGNAQINMDNGQFPKAEPGAARLLGVLSLQALPRRLTLDFRDVFQQGFAFDNLSGDVALDQGVARSNNLRIRGVQAAVLIEGQADLKRETQDLHMVVVPEINAGTASLAYAAINPAIGLGTFLAQLFLRKPLMQAGTREFHVTGSWADPQVAAVERKADSPLPEFDAAASSPQSTAR